MLSGLVAVGVIAHVGHLHLGDLVDAEAVVAVVIDGRDHEDGVQHLGEGFFAAHGIDQALNVMEDGPGIVPGVAFGEVAAPLVRAEGALEGAVGIPAPHQAVFRAVKVLPVIRAGGPFVQFLLRPAEDLRELQDAPVVIGIFQGAGGAFVDAHVTRDIAQRVIVFVAQAAGGTDGWVNVLRAMDDAVVQDLQILGIHALHDGVGHDRCGVVAHHAVAVARGGPFRQESVLAGDIGIAGLNLRVDVGIDQVQQREQGAEGVPEAGIGVQEAFFDIPVIGAVMDGIPICVDFV